MAKKQKALSKKDKAMIKKMLVAATVYRLRHDDWAEIWPELAQD